MRKYLMKMPHRAAAIAAAVSLVALVATMPGASAAPSSTWKIADGSLSNTTLAETLATFNFATGDRALLLSNAISKLGSNESGTTMSASATVQGVSGTASFTYGGEPSCGGTTGIVRLYFESIPPGTKFAGTNYWWSDTAYQVLANGTITLSATVDPTAAWSDWNGQQSSSETAASNLAAGDVTTVGLSFGGGCFFENGVGTSDGSGSFTLNSFSP